MIISVEIGRKNRKKSFWSICREGLSAKLKKWSICREGLSAKLKKWSICREPGPGLSAKEPSAWPNNQLCREPSWRLSAKRFSKKINYFAEEALGKEVFKKINYFAESPPGGSRQRGFQKKLITLPRALLEALGKEVFFKKKLISLSRALLPALGKDLFQKKKLNFFAESSVR